MLTRDFGSRELMRDVSSPSRDLQTLLRLIRFLAAKLYSYSVMLGKRLAIIP